MQWRARVLLDDFGHGVYEALDCPGAYWLSRVNASKHDDRSPTAAAATAAAAAAAFGFQTELLYVALAQC